MDLEECIKMMDHYILDNLFEAKLKEKEYI